MKRTELDGEARRLGGTENVARQHGPTRGSTDRAGEFSRGTKWWRHRRLDTRGPGGEEFPEVIGGSNGGKTEGIGVFEGDGWQLKGSVGGGSYQQPKEMKRRR